MAMGRPKIQLSDLPEGWEDKVIELASVGASDVEIRVEALGGICHETWERLIKEEPVFSETIKKAKQICQVWWEKEGRINLKNKDFSTPLWFINMKNRFSSHWSDKREAKVTGEMTQKIVWNEQKTYETIEETDEGA